MRVARRVILFALAGLAPHLPAGSLDVLVKDRKGELVSDAVVYAIRNDSKSSALRKGAVIDQRDKQFVPYVTAVQVGTSVIFPNSDKIRHHVYSLSPAKKFELPLYSGVPAAPMVFDQPGFVTLGCNIHDWMIAYVGVVPTPFFQVTGNDGRAVLKELPAGKYTVEAWQPSLRGRPEELAQQVQVAAGGAQSLLFALDLKPDFRARRGSGLSTGDYP